MKFKSIWFTKNDLKITLTIDAINTLDAKKQTLEKYKLAKERGLDWRLSPDSPKWFDSSDLK